MSLAARVLEKGGISTVVIGSARDVVEECGVPRFLFNDFPLGNPCGKPGDREMKIQITTIALGMLSGCIHPRTTVQSQFIWNAKNNDDWRINYMRVHEGNREALAHEGKEQRLRQKKTRLDAGKSKS